MKITLISFFSFFILTSDLFAGNFYHQSITANFGLVNFNLTENASNLTGEDTDAVSQGGTSSSSIFSFDLLYEFYIYQIPNFYQIVLKKIHNL